MQLRPNIFRISLALILGVFRLAYGQNPIAQDTLVVSSEQESLQSTTQAETLQSKTAQDSLMPQSAVSDTLVSAPGFLEDLVDYYGEDYVYIDQ